MIFVCAQASDFVTLAKASTATPIMDKEPPEGCAVHIIDDQSQVRGSIRNRCRARYFDDFRRYRAN